jgi:hypothetical protein
MTPLSRWLAARLPRPLACACIVATYAALLFGVLVSGGSNTRDNVYVDVKGAQAPRPLPVELPANP